MDGKYFQKVNTEKFRGFCKANKWMCLCAFMSMALMHGKHAFTTNSLFDTDDVLYHTQNSVLNWLQIGRQGNVLTKKIFGLLWYNPYFVGAVCLILFPAVIILFTYLFYMAGISKNKASLFCFAGIVMTSPIWPYQFYFSVQWFEITWALLLIVLVQLAVWKMFEASEWRRRKKIEILILFLVETLLLTWAYSSYQAFVILYVTISAGTYLISLVNAKEKFNAQEFGCRLGYLIILFLTSYILNTTITNRYFSTSDYLTRSIAWGNANVEDIINQLKLYLVRCHTGKDVQYSWLMGAGAIFILMEIVFVWIRRKNSFLYKLFFSSAAFTVWLSAHALVIYAGMVPAIRAQLVYPFVLGYQIMFLLWYIRENKMNNFLMIDKVKYWGILLLTIVGIWQQAGNTFRLWYTEDMKCKVDSFILQKVNLAIDSLNLGTEAAGYPVAFVGDYSPKLNSGCINTKETVYWLHDLSIGTSSWERVNEQPNRLIRIMSDQLGVDYTTSDYETQNHAKEISRDMPAYPADGYVQLREGIIIVKMSDYY